MNSACRCVWSVIACVLVGHASLCCGRPGRVVPTVYGAKPRIGRRAGCVWCGLSLTCGCRVPVAIQNDMTGLALKGLFARRCLFVAGAVLTLQGAVSGDYGLVVEEGRSRCSDDAEHRYAVQRCGCGQLTTAGALAYSGNRTW